MGPSKKRFLVTGAAGFIGAAIAKRLLDMGAEVWTIDNLTTGFVENIPKGVNFIQGGCEDPASIAKLGKMSFQAIYHIAGQSSGEISFDDPSYDLRANTESTLRLIEYGLKTGSTRFIYASTMSIYGDTKDYASPESLPAVPQSFYGVGKLASEHYLRLYQTKGLQPTALRFFTVYGPGQNLTNMRQGMVSIFLAQHLFSNEILVKGSLMRYRDFIFISDIVDAAIKILENEKTFGKAYNVGTGKKTTISELLNLMNDLTKLRVPVRSSGSTDGDINGIYADCSLIYKDTGFSAKVNLQEGLKIMIDWARSLPNAKI